MKQHYAKFILFCLCCLVGTKAGAHDFEVDGIYYYYNSDGTSVSVTFKGGNYNQYENEYTGEVTIPESVTYNSKTYSVTRIGSGAFYECSGLTSVNIPNSVTSIGSDAFYECSGLTSVNIPNSVTSIGEGAFFNCRGLTSIKVEEGNKTYDSRDNCNAIIKTKTNELLVGCMNTIIPNSVTSISDHAFYGCSGLTSVIIPNSVTSIDHYAFSYCSGLTSIKVEEGNKTYDSRDNCNAIIKTKTNELLVGCMNTIIPNSVTSISDHAFYGCSGLTSVTIPNSVTSIGEGAFFNCRGLTSIKVEEGNKTYDSRDNCNAIIKTKTNELLVGCMNTIIPNSVTSIGNEAFFRCSGLTSVTIPNSVTSIGYDAFEGCCGLTSVTIPNSVTSIGYGAFYGCSGLTTIKVDEANPIYDSRDNCNAIIETKTNELVIGCKSTVIPNSVTSIGYLAFYGCSGLTSVTIPNSVTSIDYGAFAGCSSLTSVTIGNSVTSIGDSAFSGCSNIKIVTINSNAITSKTYSSSSTLKNIFGTKVEEYVLGDDVTSIGDYAFDGCSGLKSVTIPNSVTSIGDKAFGSKVKIYVNRGTTSLLALWNAGYTPYEMGKYITLPPTKLTLLSSTQTTLTMKVNNIYKEYKYLYGATPLQGDIIELKNLCPNTSNESSIVVSNSIINYVYRMIFYTKGLNPKINTTSTASSINFNGTFEEGDATIKSYVLEAEVDGKNIVAKASRSLLQDSTPRLLIKEN